MCVFVVAVVVVVVVFRSLKNELCISEGNYAISRRVKYYKQENKENTFDSDDGTTLMEKTV